MAAANTDKLRKGYYGNPTTLSSGIGNTDTTLPFSSTTGWPTGTAIDVVIDRVDANGTRTPSKQETVTVVISGSNGTAAIRGVEGTAQSHSAGAVVEVLFTASTHNSTVDWALTQHNQDGSHSAITASSLVTTGTITEGSTPLASVRTESTFDFVAAGLVWAGLGYGSTLTATMTSGVAYVNGQRLAIGAVATRTFTASKDTYIDVLNTAGAGSLVYTEVANNAASPALAANSVRIGIIVTGASNIASAGSVNQGQEDKVLPIASSVAYTVTDSLGNLICPRDPNRKVLGWRQINATAQTTSTSSAQVTGLSCPVIVPTGRKVRITVHGEYLQGSVGVQNYFLEVWDGTVGGGTSLRQTTFTPGAGNYVTTAFAQAMHTPTVTSKTYNAGFHAAGPATTSLGANSTDVAYIMVELV